MKAISLHNAARRALCRCVPAAVFFCSACLPFTMGQSANTLPRGERSGTVSTFVIPGIHGYETSSAVVLGVDVEYRWGISDDSDVGVRLASVSTATFTYKKRMTGYAHPDSAAFSYLVGAGIFTLQSALFEASLLASLPKRGAIMPYGGVRIIHLLPVTSAAEWDPPSVGAFLGFRIGKNIKVLPELAVYYDEPQTAVRSRNIVVVPSISLSNDKLRSNRRRN